MLPFSTSTAYESKIVKVKVGVEVEVENKAEAEVEVEVNVKVKVKVDAKVKVDLPHETSKYVFFQKLNGENRKIIALLSKSKSKPKPKSKSKSGVHSADDKPKNASFLDFHRL